MLKSAFSEYILRNQSAIDESLTWRTITNLNIMIMQDKDLNKELSSKIGQIIQQKLNPLEVLNPNEIDSLSLLLGSL